MLTQTHTCNYAHTNSCIQSYSHRLILTLTHTHTHLCSHRLILIHTPMLTQTNTHTYTYTNTCIHSYSHKVILIRTYIYTHSYTSLQKNTVINSFPSCPSSKPHCPPAEHTTHVGNHHLLVGQFTTHCHITISHVTRHIHISDGVV